MAKKSKAQIERMKRRAAARGDVYQLPHPQQQQQQATPTTADKVSKQRNSDSTDQNDCRESATTSSNDTTTTTIISAKQQQQQQQQLPDVLIESKEHAASANKKKIAVARKLAKELRSIEANSDLNAKERRSAKRKAEAIAAEEIGCPASELLEWYNEQEPQTEQQAQQKFANDDNNKAATRDGFEDEKEEDDDDDPFQNGCNPYVVFVGQLSYTTTKEQLLEHMRVMLNTRNSSGSSSSSGTVDKQQHLEISDKTVRIRLLTDAKTRKSRGMAFVQVSNPELLYACLTLHKTLLNGRRINVERTTGGKSQSETRQAKLKRFRQEQEEYMSQLVDKLLQEYRNKGELAEGELDDGVIHLLKRHSGQVAHAALEQYVESKGRDMDNPSAYLTHLVGKIAQEMLEEKQQQLQQQQQQQQKGKHKKAKKHQDMGKKNSGDDHNNKTTTRKRKLDDDDSDAAKKKRNDKSRTKVHNDKSSTTHATATTTTATSEFANDGVDMSLSERTTLYHDDDDVATRLTKIFPSMSRGRGRGRS